VYVAFRNEYSGIHLLAHENTESPFRKRGVPYRKVVPEEKKFTPENDFLKKFCSFGIQFLEA